jgi:hypothetical protein
LYFHIVILQTDSALRALVSKNCAEAIPKLQEQLNISKITLDMLQNFSSGANANQEILVITQRLEDVLRIALSSNDSTAAIENIKDSVDLLKDHALSM